MAIGIVYEGGSMKPLQIAVSGGHTLTANAQTAITWTYSKADLGVPENGIIQDVIFNQEGADNVRTAVWVSFDVAPDKVKIRLWNDQRQTLQINFKLSVLYTMKG
jgi:hypothetical protein